MPLAKNIRFLLDSEAPHEPAPKPAAASAARNLQRMLESRFRAPSAAPDALQAKPQLRRFVKVAAGLAVVVAFGMQPALRLMKFSSAEAVVNAPLITLRAPIDGVVSVSGETLRLNNARADSGRADEAEQALARAVDEGRSLERHRAAAKDALMRNALQVDAFRKGRVRQLEARLSEFNDRIAIDDLRVEEASARAKRAARLAGSAISLVDADQARRALAIANEEALAARAQIEQTRIELDAAKAGSFLGDGYNDQPSSAQRGDELRRRVADYDADIDTSNETIVRLRHELEVEQAKFAKLEQAAVAAPPTGHIWERMVSPGENVSRGQELARYVDCSQLVVTAAVDEATYNSLIIGQTAQFIASNGETRTGRVVNLTGPADASANLAIASSVLTKAAFRVSVSIPSSSDSCGIGRTGRLVFGEQG